MNYKLIFKKNFILRISSLLLIFIANFVYAQIIAGILISSEERLPVRYAKIGFNNIERGNFSDDHGKFTLDLSGIDKKSMIKIEVAGFQTYQITVEKIAQISPLIVTLIPRITDIEEVAISSKAFITKNLGYNSKSKNLHIDFLPKNILLSKGRYTDEELEKPQMELAVPIESKDKSKIIKININFAKFNLEKAISARFIIYSEVNGKPDQIWNKEDLLFQISNDNVKNNVFTLDISDKNIWFTGKIFISFQPLEKDFSDSFWISAGVFGNAYARSFLEKWRKMPMSLVPAINIDVKTKK